MNGWFLVIAAAGAALAGCSSGPQRVKAPRIDPAKATQQAMELYDTNHDGKLSQEELARCPGVLISFERYDANHDKTIDDEEFRTHLAQLLKSGTGATELACIVLLKGMPLPGAKVAFEPE